MTIETKYRVNDRVLFRPAEQWRSDVLYGTITEVKVLVNDYTKYVKYIIDDVRTVDGKRTSTDTRSINEEDIFDVVY